MVGEFPIEREWAVAVVAELLGVTPRWVKRVLEQHADKFDQPTYRRFGSHPRLYRVIRDGDVRTLDALLPRKTARRATRVKNFLASTHPYRSRVK